MRNPSPARRGSGNDGFRFALPILRRACTGNGPRIASGRGGLQQCMRPQAKGPPHVALPALRCLPGIDAVLGVDVAAQPALALRSEEHTSELQSLMRISYAVFCLK